MKNLLWLLAFSVMVAGATNRAEAAACSAGTVSDYTALTSCTFGGLEFSGFTLDSFPGATSQIDPASVQLLPSGNGFIFTGASALSAGAGNLFGLHLAFHVAGNGLTGGTIALGDAPTVGGDGAITNLFAQTDGLGNVLASANAFAVDGASDPVASFTSGPSSFFDVFVEIGIDGGLAGSASTGPRLATLGFSPAAPIPEPGSISLLSLGLLFLAGLSRTARLRR